MTNDQRVESVVAVLDLSIITFGGVEQTKLGEKAATLLRAQQAEIERLRQLSIQQEGIEIALSEERATLRAENEAMCLAAFAPFTQPTIVWTENGLEERKAEG